MSTSRPPVPDPADKSLLGLVALGRSERDLFRHLPDHKQYLMGVLNSPGRDPLKWTLDEQAWADGWGKVCDAARPLAGRLLAIHRELDQREARRFADAEERPQRTFTPIFDGEEDLRPVEWLIDGVIPEGGAGQIFAETDLGKTFVTLDMGMHIAANLPWHGHPVKAGTVIFFAAEGKDEFALRKHAAKGAAGLGDSHVQGKLLDKKLPFVTFQETLGFGPDTDIALAIDHAHQIRAQVAERGLPPIRFVVADTLTQNMDGDTDNNMEMQAFLRVFRAFVRALSDGPVFGLLIHHPGHVEKSRSRGAYALLADLDLILHLEGETKDALTLSCKRMRSGERFDPIHLRLEQRVVTVDGEPLRNSSGERQTSLVVLPREAKPEERRTRDATKEAVLDALPEWPNKWGMNSLAAKVGAIVGRKVDHKTVTARCLALEREGLAESGPGRQKDCLSWGKANPKAGDL